MEPVMPFRCSMWFAHATLSLCLGCSGLPAFALSETGDRIIALLAFNKLDLELQANLIGVLQSHPRFTEDISAPGLHQVLRDREVIGRAAHWPETVRGTQWDRPKWHYQPGAVDVLGDVANVPAIPGMLPENASLNSQDLHIGQAIQLCRQILADPTESNPNKAIAVCWLCHLLAEAHQPCHAGSLYVQHVFPNGDRNARSINLEQGGNLHDYWDGVLGREMKADGIQLKMRSIEMRGRKMPYFFNLKPALAPETWLAESRQFAREAVYAPEILEQIKKAMQDESGDLPAVRLSEQYVATSMEVAEKRRFSMPRGGSQSFLKNCESDLLQRYVLWLILTKICNLWRG